MNTDKNRQKSAVVLGASSGIGYALARELDRRGYRLAVTARREELLDELASKLSNKPLVRFMDLRRIEDAVRTLQELFAALGNVSLVVINSGINPRNEGFLYKTEAEILDVNSRGFMAMAGATVHEFLQNGGGQLAAVSSIAALRGSPLCPAYSASKAFVSNYMEALRFKFADRGIAFTDIRPGYVDTDMIKSAGFKFWVASPERAARQIADAIERKRKIAYVTKRYALVAAAYRRIPGWLLHRVFRTAARQDPRL